MGVARQSEGAFHPRSGSQERVEEVRGGEPFWVYGARWNGAGQVKWKIIWFGV